MIVAYENATGLVMRGDPGDFADGEIVVIQRVQPRTVHDVVTRVAVVERGHGVGPGVFGVGGHDGRLEEYRGGEDFLLRWVPDDPGVQRDSRVFVLGGVTVYGGVG